MKSFWVHFRLATNLPEPGTIFRCRLCAEDWVAAEAQAQILINTHRATLDATGFRLVNIVEEDGVTFFEDFLPGLARGSQPKVSAEPDEGKQILDRVTDEVIEKRKKDVSRPVLDE
jgi:hypothetical protein